MTDLALWNRWRADGDALALQELFERHGGMVFATCRRILKNSSDAEDVAQECFEFLLKEPKSGPKLNMGAWLHAVAVNRSKNRIRAEHRQRDRDTEFGERLEQSKKESPVAIEIALDESIHELPESLRAVIVGCFLEGKSRAVVAKEQGVSRRTITTRVQDGIGQLRDSLERRGVLLAVVALTAFLESAKAQAMPTALTASLGRLALNHAISIETSAVATTGTLFSTKVAGSLAAAVVVIGVVTATYVFSPPEDTEQKSVVLAAPIDDGEVVLAAAGTVTPIEATVADEFPSNQDATWVRGTVVDLDGESVPNARVDAVWWNKRHSFFADAEGRFEVEVPVVRWDQNQIRFAWRISHREHYFFSGTMTNDSLVGDLVNQHGQSKRSNVEMAHRYDKANPTDWHFFWSPDPSAPNTRLRLEVEDNQLTRGTLESDEKKWPLFDVQRPDEIFLRAEAPDVESDRVEVALRDGHVDDVIITVHIPVGKISGIVVDQYGSPLAECRVLAHINTPEQSGTLTDNAGRFETTGLVSGDYTMYIQPNGQQRSIKHEDTIPVGDGETVEDVRLVWNPSRTFRGSVVDIAGNPIEGANVRAMTKKNLPIQIVRSENDGVPFWSAWSRSSFHFVEIGTIQTRENGTFELGGFPGDDDAIKQWTISHEDYLDARHVGPTSVNTPLNVTLRRRPTLEGQLIDTVTGLPVTAFKIHAWTSSIYDEQHLKRQSSVQFYDRDPNGRFTHKAYGEGKLTIAAVAPGYRKSSLKIDGIAEGQRVDDLVLRMEPIETVTKGFVVDGSGKSISDALIFSGFPNSLRSGNVAQSAADGTFEFAGEVYGDGIVSAYKKGYAIGWGKISGDVHRIILSSGGWLKGQVTLDGEPLGRETGGVIPLFPSGASIPVMQGIFKEDGRYEIRDALTPGKVDLEVIVPHSDPTVSHWIECTAAILDGQTTVFDIDDHSHTGHVEGTITVDGVGVNKARIWLWVDDGHGMQSNYRVRATTGGHFSLNGVPTGTVSLRVESVLDAENKSVDGVEMEATISDADITHLDFVL